MPAGVHSVLVIAFIFLILTIGLQFVGLVSNSWVKLHIANYSDTKTLALYLNEDPGWNASSQAGLYQYCLPCLDLPPLLDQEWLRTVKAMESLSVLCGAIAAFFLVLFITLLQTEHIRRSMAPPSIVMSISVVSGLLSVGGCYIYSKDVFSESTRLHVENYSTKLHYSFYLCVVAGWMFKVAGLLVFAGGFSQIDSPTSSYRPSNRPRSPKVHPLITLGLMTLTLSFGLQMSGLVTDYWVTFDLDNSTVTSRFSSFADADLIWNKTHMGLYEICPECMDIPEWLDFEWLHTVKTLQFSSLLCGSMAGMIVVVFILVLQSLADLKSMSPPVILMTICVAAGSLSLTGCGIYWDQIYSEVRAFDLDPDLDSSFFMCGVAGVLFCLVGALFLLGGFLQITFQAKGGPEPTSRDSSVADIEDSQIPSRLGSINQAYAPDKSSHINGELSATNCTTEILHHPPPPSATTTIDDAARPSCNTSGDYGDKVGQSPSFVPESMSSLYPKLPSDDTYSSNIVCRTYL